MPKKSDLPPAPTHLTAATADWWRAIVADYDLEAADLRVLEAACVQWDRAAAAKDAIAKSEFGPLTKDRFGQLKPHPAIEVEQAATRLFLAAVRQLGLGLEGPDDMRLPDAIAPYRRGQ
jgi:P27 family predicted phage terminase small subunit